MNPTRYVTGNHSTLLGGADWFIWDLETDTQIVRLTAANQNDPEPMIKVKAIAMILNA